jgi:hypothetical protein
VKHLLAFSMSQPHPEAGGEEEKEELKHVS